MVLGALLTKAAVGTEIARNGIIGTIKGIGDILKGTREGLITVVQDVQKMTGNWTEPNNSNNKNPKTNVEKEGGKTGE